MRIAGHTASGAVPHTVGTGDAEDRVHRKHPYRWDPLAYWPQPPQGSRRRSALHHRQTPGRGSVVTSRTAAGGHRCDTITGMLTSPSPQAVRLL